MRRVPRCLLCVVGILGAVWTVGGSPAFAAQDRQGRAGRAAALEGGEPQGVTPGEIQRMFDSYALLQAQEQLKITDEQFAQFLPRFKALLDVRRRALGDRMRLVQELRQLVNAPQPDEAQMREKV